MNENQESGNVILDEVPMSMPESVGIYRDLTGKLHAVQNSLDEMKHTGAIQYVIATQKNDEKRDVLFELGNVMSLIDRIGCGDCPVGLKFCHQHDLSCYDTFIEWVSEH
jgi:hypothetical protein